MKVFTADELIAAIKAAATASPDGGASLVRVGDWEGNLSANGLVETLEIKSLASHSRKTAQV